MGAASPRRWTATRAATTTAVAESGARERCAGEAGAPAWLLRGGDRIGDRPAVPVAVDGPDADLVVVLVEPGDRVVGDVPDPSCVRPERLGGVAPDDLVAGDVGLRVRVPAQ